MEPIDDIIPREIENKELEKLLGTFSEGLDSVVNFGSNILKWDLEEFRAGDENIPITLSLRHYIELVDSISILVKKGAVDTSKLLLRGALEVYFGFEYLFEADTHDRSMAFLVWYFHKKLKFYNKLDLSTQQGQQFQTSINRDRLGLNFSDAQSSSFDNEKRNWESLLQQPIYSKAEAEYQRLNQSGESNPSWYRLFNGPRNIEQLANHLNLILFYEILYRQWSGPTHGTDIFEGKIFGNSDGSADIVQIRYAKDAQMVTHWAVALSLKVFKIFIQNRLPNKKEAFHEWYSTIRQLYLSLSAHQMIKVEI